MLAVFPQGKKEVFEVTLSDGRSTLCNDEHLWSYYQVYNKINKEPSLLTKPLKELIKMKNPIYIPTSEAVEFTEKKYKICWMKYPIQIIFPNIKESITLLI